MLEAEKIVGESLKFKFFKEFTTNTGFLLFPLISEMVIDGIYAVFSPLHLLLLVLIFIQTYLLIKTKNLTTSKVFFINLLAPGIYIFIELLILGSIFNELLYLLYIFYIFINSSFRSIIFYFNLIKKNNISSTFSFIDIVFKLILIPVFFYLLFLELGNEISLYNFYFSMDNRLNTFLFFIFIYLAFIFGLGVYIDEKRKFLLNNLLSILHKYSSWIVDSKSIEKSINTGEVDLSCKKMYKAVIFMDIRGFTSWSENNPPEDVTIMLNGFYRQSELLIGKYKTGTINKYVADEIIFVFDDLVEAIDFSIELKEKEIKYLDKYGLKVGFGINAGELIYGWIGGEMKKEQTVIGDVVNVAARLEGGINMIKIPKHLLPAYYNSNELGFIELKGKSQKMEVVEVISKK